MASTQESKRQETRLGRRLAALLKWLEAEKGVTRAQFQKRTDIDGGQITRILDGTQRSSPKLIHASRDVFGIFTSYWTSDQDLSPALCQTSQPGTQSTGEGAVMGTMVQGPHAAAELARLAKQRGEPDSVVAALLDVPVPVDASPAWYVKTYLEVAEKHRRASRG